jgi:phosphate transport system permease protein
MATDLTAKSASQARSEELTYSVGNRRTWLNKATTVVAVGIALLALSPLISALVMLLTRGVPSLSVELLTELPPGAGTVGGGIGNAILGTLVLVSVASALALPIGLLAAVCLAEYGGTSTFATVVRFAGKVLTGMPSILAGVFAYATVVTLTGSFSVWAGGVATAILMIPIIMLTAEEALRMVPQKMRQAALGMGATRAQMVLQIVVPAALPSIVTGVMLALARAMGETAPLLFTALFSNYWFDGKLEEPIASLAVLIYNYSGSPFDNQVNLAWAAALILVSLVLITNLTAQFVFRREKAQ